jgi:hypothetical protein
MPNAWDLSVGSRIRRRDLHAIYGGSWYGGIEPSAKTPNVLLFTSATAGAQFGYAFDGWHRDGTFHYTGDGQVGDQLMKDGNRAVRDHIDDGRALRLFEKDGTYVTYVGEFELPDESHILRDEALDRNQANLRSVFVFRLRPVGPTWEGCTARAPEGGLAQEVPLEAANIESYVRERAHLEPEVALRTEAALVARYSAWIARAVNGTTTRQAIPTAAGHMMYTDLFVRETRELVEAKSSSSRTHMRSALGQILDYARYVPHSSLAILVPSQPDPEMTQLLIAHGVGCIWESEKRGVFDSVSVPDAWLA